MYKKNVLKWVKVGFIGQFEYSLDAKNRVNIPAKFRKMLDVASESSLILTLGVEKCISVYPSSHWQVEINNLNNLDTTITENRKYMRALAANAFDSAVDKQGRIIIPNHLKDYAKLKKDVLIIGMFEKIEIWDKKEYDSVMSGTISDLESVAMNVVKP